MADTSRLYKWTGNSGPCTVHFLSTCEPGAQVSLKQVLEKTQIGMEHNSEKEFSGKEKLNQKTEMTKSLARGKEHELVNYKKLGSHRKRKWITHAVCSFEKHKPNWPI